MVNLSRLLLLFIYLFAAQVSADIYKVELIAFENKKVNYEQESLALAANLPEVKNAIFPREQLGEDVFLLHKESKTLTDKSYDIIGHYNWLADINSKNVLLAVPMQNGMQLQLRCKIARNLFYVELDGRYFAGQRELSAMNYKLQHKLRAKPKEVYYLDHPLVGIFIMIHPDQPVVQ